MTSIFASGAEELLITLQTPAPRGNVGIPTLLWGPPGHGKTTFVESLASEDFPVEALIASIHDPTDFLGLPIHEDGRVRFAPPEWALSFEATGQGILLLDELTTAAPAVQAALLRVVLERKVGYKSLPAGVRVVAAANPPDSIAGGWELSPPLANRFVHLSWELSGSTLVSALREGFSKPQLPVIEPHAHREAAIYWRMMTAAFLQRDPSLVHTRPADGEHAFASPRTWDFAIQLMASCEVLKLSARPGSPGSTSFFRLLEGSVGSGAATSLLGFLKELRLPDPDKVLDGKETVDVTKLKDDELHIFFCSLSASLLRRRADVARDNLLSATLATLHLIERVNGIGRVDAVFAPVRQLARGQTLQRAAYVAKQQNRVGEFRNLVEGVFANTPLADYVTILEPPHGPPSA